MRGLGLTAIAIVVAALLGETASGAAPRCKTPAHLTFRDAQVVVGHEKPSGAVYACAAKIGRRVRVGEVMSGLSVSVEGIFAGRWLWVEEDAYAVEGDGEDSEVHRLYDLRSGRFVERGARAVGAPGMLLFRTKSGLTARRLSGGDTLLDAAGDEPAANARVVYWRAGDAVRSRPAAEILGRRLPAPVASSAGTGVRVTRACRLRSVRVLFFDYATQVVRTPGGRTLACGGDGAARALPAPPAGYATAGVPSGFTVVDAGDGILFRRPLQGATGRATELAIVDVETGKGVASVVAATAPREVVASWGARAFASTDGASVELLDGKGRRAVDSGTISDLAMSSTTLYWTNAGVAKSTPLAP